MFAGVLSSCPVCQSRQAAVDLSEIKSGRAVMTRKSLAGKLQPLMADALFLFIFLQQREEEQSSKVPAGKVTPSTSSSKYMKKYEESKGELRGGGRCWGTQGSPGSTVFTRLRALTSQFSRERSGHF